MTTSTGPAGRPTVPALTCPPSQVGPCANCQEPTHRYGPGACPLCVICLAEVEAHRGRGKAGAIQP